MQNRIRYSCENTGRFALLNSGHSEKMAGTWVFDGLFGNACGAYMVGCIYGMTAVREVVEFKVRGA